MTTLLHVHVEFFIRIGYKKAENDKYYIDCIMMFLFNIILSYGFFKLRCKKMV